MAIIAYTFIASLVIVLVTLAILTSKTAHNLTRSRYSFIASASQLSLFAVSMMYFVAYLLLFASVWFGGAAMLAKCATWAFSLNILVGDLAGISFAILLWTWVIFAPFQLNKWLNGSYVSQPSSLF